MKTLRDLTHLFGRFWDSSRRSKRLRESRRFVREAALTRLEDRQLLTTGFVTETQMFSASIPVQTTDYTLPLILPRFDATQGTLTKVNLSFVAGGNFGGSVTNNGESAATITTQANVALSLVDGTTTLLNSSLPASQTYQSLPSGSTAPFGPFTPSQSASHNYTNGATFNDFNGGPGNINLSLSTLSTQTTDGGGGNVASNLTTAAGGSATVTYTFQVQAVAISGNVYNDASGTGSLTSGDPPIPGTVLTLLDSGGHVVAMTTAGPDGSYSFTTDASGTLLLAGTYTVHETQPIPYLQGTNTVGTVNGIPDGMLTSIDTIASIKLTAGQESLNNNFGELLPVGLAGNVYQDVKGTGSLAPGDLPIPGTILTLLDATGTVVATTSTLADGTYSFAATTSGALLVPGTYSVHETQPIPYLQGTNTVGSVNGVTDGMLIGIDTISNVVLKSGQISVNNNYGEILPVTVSGTVYQDINHTGSLVPGDLPIPGTTVSLFGPGGLVATTLTDSVGNYVFTTSANGQPLLPSTYFVVEAQPNGFNQGTNTVGTVNGVTVGNLPAVDIIGSVVLTSGRASIHNNFGEILAPSSNICPLYVVNVQRFGVHLQPTLVVLSFDQPLDPATVQTLANYKITGPSDSKNPGAVIPIESATYNRITQMVTLRLAQRLDVHHPYQLTVVGLKSNQGALLTGTNGQAGGAYLTILDRSQLAGFTDIYGNFIPVDHGRLYSAATLAASQHKRFVLPQHLGPFASANSSTFQAATAGHPQPSPISLRRVKATSAPRLRHY